MIITLVEAQEIDPNATQGQLDAYESAIRQLTANNFQDTSCRIKGAWVSKTEEGTVRVYPINPAGEETMREIQLQDTLQLTLGSVSSLLEVIGIMPDYVECSGQVRRSGVFSDAVITLVVYPADIKQGVKGLIKYDKNFADKKGIKSETISRMSLTYYDVNSAEAVNGYPAAEMSFIKKYTKMRWG
jgi:hypothetical protein